jgi:hypothetical protein
MQVQCLWVNALMEAACNCAQPATVGSPWHKCRLAGQGACCRHGHKSLANAGVHHEPGPLVPCRLAAQESLNARATETAEQLAAVQQQLGVLNSILDSMRQENGALKVS